MRLLILLLAIVIGNARARQCKWNTQADYSVANNVLTFKNECTSIGPGNNNCYGFPSGVTSVTIPDSVTTIAENAFDECSNLISMSFSTMQQAKQVDVLFDTEINPDYDFWTYIDSMMDSCEPFAYQDMPEFEGHCKSAILSQTQATFNPNIAITIRGLNPCTEGNWHSDACKNKIAEEYSQTQFIDLYNRNYTSTCS